MKHKSRYIIGCSFLLVVGCSADDEAESGQISRGFAESAALNGGDIDATPNKNLSYSTNPGAITSIKYGNHVLTTGGYLFVRNQGDLVVNSSGNIPLFRVGR